QSLLRVFLLLLPCACFFFHANAPRCTWGAFLKGRTDRRLVMLGQEIAYFCRLAAVWRKPQVTFNKLHRSGEGILGCKEKRSTHDADDRQANRDTAVVHWTPVTWRCTKNAQR